MHGRRNPFVAHEGLPWLALCFAAVVVAIRYFEPWISVIPGILFVLLYLLFRDPPRAVPPVALGVLSPVDGVVVEIGRTDSGEIGDAALRIVIEINSFGTYTARAPVEGTIKDLGKRGLWLQTDEEQDVVLKFAGYRLGLAPRSFARYGERLGQGQRCAYLRLARRAEVQFPTDGKMLVEIGQTVVAGTDVIGSVHGSR